MFKRLLSFIGDSNERELRRLQPTVDRINTLEPQFEKQSDDELRARTTEFKARLAEGESLDSLLPEVFAAVREAAKRTIKQRHFDVQLMGGIVLHQGRIAEMKTGEGKTLVATLPVSLNALTGRGVHVVTVNDYLAKRDTQWMGSIYNALGISVACIQHEAAFQFDPSYESEDPRLKHLRPITRRQAYEADVTYGTNNEFGFDYLRDNMVVDLSQCVQRELNYAIVDEVDNILIDEARTPLIISGAAEDATQRYYTFAKLIPRLRQGEDYVLEERTRSVTLTEVGLGKMEQWLHVPNLYDPANYALTHYIDNALKAYVLYKKDRDYVVKDGEVIIVDEFTGRLMHGRRYSEGLHQAIEAKEGVKIQRESVTMATITFQNYFRMYEKLAGMTGTAVTEAEEFDKIYKLDVVVIPTNKSLIREEYKDQIYKNEESKFRAVVREIEQYYKEGRPVLVGTVSIEKSEHLSQMLLRQGIQHQVLNAKHHEKEAAIVAQAGRLGAVTIATNMAGRGVDIILGGTTDERGRVEWEEEHNKVVQLGGLHVVGTERHEARRIDNQLR
ncbi:MAG: preprotein translocase subunit SecA, partial [Chloroflexi bacterium]|nr:preprotein translocase subunit SecA [Chloroflexota bacterium]